MTRPDSVWRRLAAEWWPPNLRRQIDTALATLDKAELRQTTMAGELAACRKALHDQIGRNAQLRFEHATEDETWPVRFWRNELRQARDEIAKLSDENHRLRARIEPEDAA